MYTLTFSKTQMTTKTLILAGNRILEIWALLSVSRSPCSTVTHDCQAAPHSCPAPDSPFPFSPSSCYLMRCSPSISNTKRKIHSAVRLWLQPFLCPLEAMSWDSWVTCRTKKSQACLTPNWLAKMHMTSYTEGIQTF